jgi:uncharacterized BrkB/YihY/UPF0761 family membrane protein
LNTFKNDALNKIWQVKPKPGKGIWDLIRKRLLSFGMVLAIGFLLLVSLIISASLSALSNFRQNFFPGFELFWQVLNFAVSFGFISLLFALMYKYLPDVKITWRKEKGVASLWNDRGREGASCEGEQECNAKKLILSCFLEPGKAKCCTFAKLGL